MNESFEVLPFGGQMEGEMESEMERSRVSFPRGGGRGPAGARGGGRMPGKSPGGARFRLGHGSAGGGMPGLGRGGPSQVGGAPFGGHVPFRERHGRRGHFPAPWPYYYGPYYGPGWGYPAPPAAGAPYDGNGDAGADTDAGASDDAPQGEFGTGCNCPKCRQRAEAFEILPFG